jgi:hypothetical protein
MVHPEAVFQLITGKSYEVFGIGVFDTTIAVLIADDSILPAWVLP